jgi:hypothetical protein
MDDFIFAEPQAVPHPGPLVLVGAGLLMLGARLGARRLRLA